MQGFSSLSNDTVRWLALLAATVAISIGFFQMTGGLLIPLVLAAIAGAIARPMTVWLTAAFGGRPGLGSAISLLILIIAVFAPLLGLLTLAVSQASSLLNGLEGLADQVDADSMNQPLPSWIPFEGTVRDLIEKIIGSLGTMAQEAARFFVSSLSSVTIGAATFFLHMFVFLYALFFFLQMETPVIAQILRFSGLPAQTQGILHERIVSISRATIKGTLTIALIQGSMGGVSFWLTGIDGAAFWAVVMMVLAMLPGFGAPFGILCGAAYLALGPHHYVAAGALIAWAGVVSVIDNLLRPPLVGRDAQLHDLIILISTLGGLGLFGASGLVLGPVLAGLFVTIWKTLAETLAQDDPTEQGDGDV